MTNRDIWISGHRDIGRAEQFKMEGGGMGLDKHHDLRKRTKDFALRVIKMTQAIPSTRVANVINNQILRSATGMAANYRAAGLARSKSEFISKMGIVVEEADETVFWLELLAESGVVKPSRLGELLAEANQFVFIFSASRRTAKA